MLTGLKTTTMTNPVLQGIPDQVVIPAGACACSEERKPGTG
jgi:hypothetical protein